MNDEVSKEIVTQVDSLSEETAAAREDKKLYQITLQEAETDIIYAALQGKSSHTFSYHSQNITRFIADAFIRQSFKVTETSDGIFVEW